MIQVSNNDKIFLQKNVENADELLKLDDMNPLLEALYMAIEINGFDENEDYNDFGRQAQKVYDNIYYNN